MQVLALISIYAPVVIIVVAVIAVLFSFFWVLVPLPRAMGQLLIRFWRWRERSTCTAIVRRRLCQITIVYLTIHLLG